MGSVSASGISMTGGGALLIYSALAGKKWTAALHNVISGESPVEAAGNPITGAAATSPGDTGAATQTAAHNQATARLLAAAYGWSGGQEWADLVSLWNQESGWSNTALNSSSGAYGIPQALPPTKLPLAGQSSSAGGRSDAAVQIAWGLRYINTRYGSPSVAWAHEQANDWY